MGKAVDISLLPASSNFCSGFGKSDGINFSPDSCSFFSMMVKGVDISLLPVSSSYCGKVAKGADCPTASLIKLLRMLTAAPHQSPESSK